jgi:hypothetical protein
MWMIWTRLDLSDFRCIASTNRRMQEERQLSKNVKVKTTNLDPMPFKSDILWSTAL